jgi:hypothetical protein
VATTTQQLQQQGHSKKKIKEGKKFFKFFPQQSDSKRD